MSETRKRLEQWGFEPSLHGRWYRDQRLFERETRDLFQRDWLCVGREEDWSGPGDHAVLDVAGESILVVRNSEGRLRAFYNVCRHRGAQLCPLPGEQAPASLQGGVRGKRLIRCPYHAWTYDLDGQLVNAPFMEEQAGFDRGAIALHDVGLATWGGFVFLNLSPETAPDFDALVAAPGKRLARYPLAELRTARHIDYTVAANWKVLCENYNECYHCGPVHPELCAIAPAFRDHGGGELDWERGVPHRTGATTFTASGESARRSFPGLDEDEQVRHKGELLLPNLFLSVSREHAAAFILRPRACDRTEIRCLFLFEPHEMAKADFAPEDAVDFWHQVNLQDWAICERVQRGMGARVFDYGALSPLEDWSLDVRRYVTERTGLDESGLDPSPSS